MPAAEKTQPASESHVSEARAGQSKASGQARMAAVAAATVRRPVGRTDAEVTVSLTAGADRTATERTLNTFLNCCTDTARVGEELDFTIYMLNSGDRALTNIVLADALPRRLELVPGSAAASLPADFTTETGDDGSVVLTWRLTEPLPVGESGFVRFRVLVR